MVNRTLEEGGDPHHLLAKDAALGRREHPVDIVTSIEFDEI